MRVPAIFLIVAALVLLIIGINYLTFGGISRFLHTAGEPLWRAQTGATSVWSTIVLEFKSKQSLRDENERLKAENTTLTFSAISAEVLRHENEDLRRLLKREGQTERIAAAVLARPNRTVYDTLVVDVGRRDGVLTHARVVSAGDVVIGTVVEVYAETSLVSLYSTPGRVTEVFLGKDQAVSAEAVGRGGGDFEVRIPRGIEVAEGQPVFSPLLHGGVLGVVEDITSLPSNSFQTILFKSPVNIKSLRIVAIELQ